jgi:hypothetical protein
MDSMEGRRGKDEGRLEEIQIEGNFEDGVGDSRSDGIRRNSMRRQKRQPRGASHTGPEAANLRIEAAPSHASDSARTRHASDGAATRDADGAPPPGGGAREPSDDADTSTSGAEDTPTSGPQSLASFGIETFMKRFYGRTSGSCNTTASKANMFSLPRKSPNESISGTSVALSTLTSVSSMSSNVSNGSRDFSNCSRTSICQIEPILPQSEASSHGSPSEVQLRRIKSVSSVNCRICQLTEIEADEPLKTVPCNCKGSLQFAHESCVKKWTKIQRSNKCEICKGALTAAASDDGDETDDDQGEDPAPQTWLDNLTQRLMVNMGVTTDQQQLTPAELEEIRHVAGRQIQKAVLSAAICMLTIAIVITCYMVVMTSQLTVGIPLLSILVIVTLICKEKHNSIVAWELDEL